jgi:hypothetical protein
MVIMASGFKAAFHRFFAVTRKGYDDYYWIFVIIAGAGIITKLFGITGAGASIVGFVAFYVLGRLSIRREKKLKEERLLEKKKNLR